MISFEEALSRVLQHLPSSPDIEDLPLDCALGRVLAEPLIARHDSPRFDNSAVDGYGLKVADADRKLKVVSRSEAGASSEHELQAGEAARILTGAAIPNGVDAVVMQEDVEIAGDTITVPGKVKSGMHIRRHGEEYRAGTTLLHSGLTVSPSVIGLAAANGVTHLTVFRQPKVHVISTGTELTPVGNELGASAVYDSNGPAISSAVRSLGFPCHYESVDDNEERLRKCLETALHQNDIVITTGGVSVGDRDLVRSTWQELGVEEVFWKVKIKPGKPVWFGVKGDKLVFGLPGNPVSALVTFYLFVRPTLCRMQVPTIFAQLTESIKHKTGREEFVRGQVQFTKDRVLVTPTEGQGSHMMLGIAAADCLLRLPAEQDEWKTGDKVEVIRMQWSAL